ncbi:MAG: ABC transporter permease [Lachnospiraceae bacterium]|nr:ABC transporter permease [Lachnospiraceae bacterium]
MRNPLHKRLPRELREEAGKYLVILLLLVLSIGFVSGFLVADGSLMAAYEESFEKYNVEDGHFSVRKALNRAQKKAAESCGITIYDNFYRDEALTSHDNTLRIFCQRTEVNLVCLMEGEMPTAAGEIAVDRMYAENNGIEIGDTLAGPDGSWTVTGLIALSDYSSLFSDNNDAMFDAVQFGVAVVTEEAFANFSADDLIYSYAWKYDTAPVDEKEEKEMSDALMEALAGEISLETYIPRYLNQAIQFTGEDMGSDRGMMITLLYMVIAILAFVFGITIRHTIAREAGVIGTLRASGYTRRELLAHYMTVPMAVTFCGALLGNVLGYTLGEDLCAGMYYGSYSLPTYVTCWSGEAFVLTTVIPVLMMAVLDAVILLRDLRLSPLKFLRHDLSRGRGRRALPLPARLPFWGRFRVRILLQNAGGYLMMFVGIVFANLLLMFGLGLPAVLDYYQETIEENRLSEYQYMLQMPLDTEKEGRRLESTLSLLYFSYAVQTENEDAEKFSAYTLTLQQTETRTEEVTLYGVEPDSRYVTLNAADGEIYISSAYAEKYLVGAGDTITLSELYEDTEYELTVTGVYDYEGAICVFMTRSTLNALFGLEEDYFCGYFSDTEITDIDEAYIGSVIDLEALTKISRQLDVSMGSMMLLVDGFAVLIFVVLIYLLSKLVVEKNASSISMVRILGYTEKEIRRLYLSTTTLVVAASLLLSLPLVYRLLVVIFRIMLITSMTGWLPLVLEPVIYVKMFALGMASYGIVAVLEFRRIRRIPMDLALKHAE